MNDTPEEIQAVQRKILAEKTHQERFMIGADLINFGRMMVENSIRRQYPDISVIDLKIEVLKRCYASEFSSKEMESIVAGMRNYFLYSSDDFESSDE